MRETKDIRGRVYKLTGTENLLELRRRGRWRQADMLSVRMTAGKSGAAKEYKKNSSKSTYALGNKRIDRSATSSYLRE